MRRMNLGKSLLLLVTLFGLFACGDDVLVTKYEDRNSNDKLCNKTWRCTYDNPENGDIIVHELLFNTTKKSGGTRDGKETRSYYRDANEKKPYYLETFNFAWSWMDNNMEGLFLDRGGDEIILFHNVFVRNNYLSGELDGTPIVFKRVNK